jgi:hypothetical protein
VPQLTLGRLATQQIQGKNYKKKNNGGGQQFSQSSADRGGTSLRTKRFKNLKASSTLIIN